MTVKAQSNAGTVKAKIVERLRGGVMILDGGMGSLLQEIGLEPGQAPEQEVVSAYDINDYKSKTELTAQKLYTKLAETDPEKVVGVTAGVEGSYFVSKEGAFHQPSFKVEVVDTTGCGDVFHGAFAFGSRNMIVMAQNCNASTAATPPA